MSDDELHLGDRVYLRCADERRAGMITGILIRPTGVQYDVVWGTGASTWHYAMELSNKFVPNFKDG